ncbi:770_t:CDS:2, partial [Gigaspora rosea]
NIKTVEKVLFGKEEHEKIRKRKLLIQDLVPASPEKESKLCGVKEKKRKRSNENKKEKEEREDKEKVTKNQERQKKDEKEKNEST